MHNNWRQAKLGDICDLIKGTSPTQRTKPGPYPLVVTAAEALTSDQYQFEGEAVCVPLVSSTGHGHASLKRVHYASGKFAVANIITACLQKPGAEIDMRYLWHLLHHKRNQLIVPLMRGTANVSLSQALLATVPVLLPPLRQQRRIVDLMDSVSDVILSTSRARETSPYDEMLSWLDTSTANKIPIAEAVTQAYAGGTPSRKNSSFFGPGFPWLKSGEVDDDGIVGAQESITAAGLNGSAAKLVPASSTVVAMYGQGDTKGRAGYIVKPVTTNQAVLALIPDRHKVLPRFLLHAMRSQTESLRAQAVGAAQPNLSKGLVLSHKIPLPPLDQQESLSTALDGVLDVRRRLDRQLVNLQLLRSNALTALSSGEHEIPESYDELMEA